MHPSHAPNPYRLFQEGNPTIRQQTGLRVLPEPLPQLIKIGVFWEATGLMKEFSYAHKFSVELAMRDDEIILIVDFIYEKLVFRGNNLFVLALLFWKEEPPQIFVVRNIRYCIDLAEDEFLITEAVVEK